MVSLQMRSWPLGYPQFLLVRLELGSLVEQLLVELLLVPPERLQLPTLMVRYSMVAAGYNSASLVGSRVAVGER